MRGTGRVLLASLLVVLAGLAVPAVAEETVRHSGTVVSISDGANTFVLAELGPWEQRDGATVVTRRTITLTPATEFTRVARADAAPSGFAGDFVEVPVGAEDIALDDFVTVVCRVEGKRLIAVKITVPERR